MCSSDLLTKTVGFKFVYNVEKDQIAHPAGLMILTPKGKLSRYFYGTTYPPESLRLSMVEAGENRIGSVVDKIILYCSPFDMHKGKYTPSLLNLMKVAGVGTALILFLSITVLSIHNRRVPLRKSDLTAEGKLKTDI